MFFPPRLRLASAAFSVSFSLQEIDDRLLPTQLCRVRRSMYASRCDDSLIQGLYTLPYYLEYCGPLLIYWLELVKLWKRN